MLVRVVRSSWEMPSDLRLEKTGSFDDEAVLFPRPGPDLPRAAIARSHYAMTPGDCRTVPWVRTAARRSPRV
jgi:hypothetical protein